MRTTETISISLPSKQLKSAERLAKKQNRTMSELVREGLRRLEQEDEQQRPSRAAALAELGEIVRLIREEARRAGLDKMTKREVNAEVEAARRQLAANARGPAKRSRK